MMAAIAVRQVPTSRARAWVVIAAAAGLIVGLFAGPVLAQDPAQPSQTTAEKEHTISVTGVGRVFVTPDLAEVSLGVQIERRNLRAARTQAAQIMDAVLAALRNLGIADADIRTTMLNVSPVYEYTTEQPQMRGFSVTNIVSVHVRDLEDLAAVVDDSIAGGATNVNGITFRLADPTVAEHEAREAAVQDARTRAETLATAAGITITGVASIAETYSSPWDWQGGDREGGEAPTPVLPGTSEVSITVSMEFLIE